MFKFNTAIICQPAGQPADDRLESHTKIIFFFEKNAVGHTTFVGWLTGSAGLIIHA